MKALILDAENKSAQVQEVPAPTPSPGEVLIRVEYVSLNPIDAKLVFQPIAPSGRIVGSDFAGQVVSLGNAGEECSLKIGDRVAGFLQGSNSVNTRPGAYAEYVVASQDLVWRIPESMGLDAAAGLSLTSLTAAQAVYHRLGLKAPFTWDGAPENQTSNSTNEITFFIYGASTSVGLYAAQYVRLSAAASGKKIKLIGAASPGRFNMLKAAPYSYDALVDYRQNDWPEKLVALAGSTGVQYAYDCISLDTTVPLVAKTMPNGGYLAVVRAKANPAWAVPDNIKVIGGAVWETFGVELQYYGGISMPPSPEGVAFGKGFFKWLSERGGLQPTPVRLMPGGLSKIVDDGFALLEGTAQDRTDEWMKPISAEKLVYKV